MPGAFIVEAADAVHRTRLCARSRRSLLASHTGLAIFPCRNIDYRDAARNCPDGFLVLSAGLWFSHPESIAMPEASATGRPVLGFGLTPLGHPEWRDLRRNHGGDLTGQGHPLRTTRPPVMAVDSRACALLNSGRNWQEVLEMARIVHLSELDAQIGDELRVVQIITSLQLGGAERIAQDLHRQLPGAGIAAQLVVLGRPGRTAFPVPPGGVDLSEIPGDLLTRVRAAAVAANRFGADLLHAHLLGAEEIRALGANGIPVLLTLHNTFAGWPPSLMNLREEDVRMLVACSLGVQADARKHFPALPVRTAWNGIDPQLFRRTPDRAAQGREIRRQSGIGESDLLLITLANPRPQKRLDRLPAVAACLRALFPGRKVRLWIVGEAAAFHAEAAQCVENVKREAEALGVADTIHFYGPTRDAPGLLAAADVLVSTSAHEGLSLAHLEALAMGLPVVALEAGGTGEAARAAGPAMTLLPQDSSPADFAAAVLAAAGRKVSGREAVARCFSLESMAHRYRQLYHRALSSPRTAGRTIWLICNNFAMGGAQSSARRLLTFWHRQGIPVRAVVLQEDKNDPSSGRMALGSAGIPVLALPRLGLHEAAETLAPLWQELEADPPKAILLWNVVTSCKRIIADGMLRTPIFDVSPGGMFFEALHPSFVKLRADLPADSPADYGKMLTGAVVKYSREKPQAETSLGVPVSVIPNGVGLPEEVVAFRENPDPFVFGTAARLHPQKRLGDLLAAWRLALPGLPPSVLRIAGEVDGEDGEYACLLRQESSDLPVEWVGGISPIWRFHQGLDAFVMISAPAGCPNASLEAMASGLAVIATDAGGASEQVIDGLTGFLVPPEDAQRLADAMVRIAGNAALRRSIAVNARQHVENSFSMPLMAGRYWRLIYGRGGSVPGLTGSLSHPDSTKTTGVWWALSKS